MIQCLLFISLVIFARSVPRASFQSIANYASKQQAPETVFSHQKSPKIFPGRWFSKVKNVPEAVTGGLIVRCEEKSWRIVVKRQYFGDDVVLSPTSVRLGEDGAPGECTPMKDFTTSTEMVISARLQDCGSESRYVDRCVACAWVDSDPLSRPGYEFISNHGFRLFALLLIVLEWIQPGLPSPLRPICDLRVLNHFVKEARDAEAAMRVCKEECSIAVPLTVPLTRVDFDVWEKKNTEEQAKEVQTGLWLLNSAISSFGASITNSALQSHIEASVRNIASLKQVLRSLSIQDYVPTADGTGETWTVSSASELFQVQSNFLRGKVRLLLSIAPVCQQNNR
ncbi:Erythropoietin [Bagarius yarrelli]|uniref:Erythropoietin n=1 Tax=Bagarius yarrelli TaxID=175774 RepID=A0A556TUQ6_BAGYA|nr:Erythropoietin [Bagarius yarrelli]